MINDLKKTRLKKGYSTKIMAEKLNISTAFYNQIENERRKLSYKMAVNISNVFEMKPDDLFYNHFKEK